MPNTLTDQYQIVKTSTLDANFIQILLGKTVNYNDGFCRELFRDGKHLRSLRSPTDSFSARKGDTMLSVNMGIVTLPFADKIPTRDGYFISYDATARLIVQDPRTFAVCYMQGIDPLQKTVDVILAALKKEVARGKHDDMSDVFLRSVVESHTGARRPLQTQLGWQDVTPVVEYGVAIVDAQTMSPHADPKRTAEIEEAKRVEQEKERLRKEKEIELAKLQQREALQAEQLRVQDELAKQQRVIDERKYAEAHQDDLKQFEHDRYKLEQAARRNAALDMQIEAARQQEAGDRALLRRLRDQGIPTITILQEYPELGYLLERRDVLTGQLLNGPELRQLTTPEARPSSSSGSNASDTARDLHGITREPRADDIYTISHLSIKVSRHVLSEHETGLAQAQDQSFGYLVEVVLTSWPQEQDLQAQDLIYQIDDKPVPELNDLAPYLDMRQLRGEPIKVTYLRGEDSLVTLIDIPPTQR
jgi:hypothetical protein